MTKLNLWQNLRTQIMKTKKNQNVTNLKNSTGVTNSNCYEIQKLKLWQNSKTQMVTKLKTQNVTKLKNSNCDKTENVKKKNSKTQNGTKLKGLWCYARLLMPTVYQLLLWQFFFCKNLSIINTIFAFFFKY